MVNMPEPFHVFHFGHAFERHELLEVDLVALGAKFNMEFQHGLWLSNADDEPGLLMTARVDLRTFRCISYRQVDHCSCEFPAVHPGRHVIGPPDDVPRYTYLMANDGGLTLPYTHIVKVDRHGECRQSYGFEDCSVGEPCFVPREGAVDEDDGYILAQVFHPAKHNTSFAVLDAKNLIQGPICSLDLRGFLPNGFHGTWSQEVFAEPASRI